MSFKRLRCYKNIWVTSFKGSIYQKKARIISFKMVRRQNNIVILFFKRLNRDIGKIFLKN